MGETTFTVGKSCGHRLKRPFKRSPGLSFLPSFSLAGIEGFRLDSRRSTTRKDKGSSTFGIVSQCGDLASFAFLLLPLSFVSFSTAPLLNVQ
nr:hypothetical protein Q903MT_gene2451 [Picea sitchensis]